MQTLWESWTENVKHYLLIVRNSKHMLKPKSKMQRCLSMWETLYLLSIARHWLNYIAIMGIATSVIMLCHFRHYDMSNNSNMLLSFKTGYSASLSDVLVQKNSTISGYQRIQLNVLK